ncbi:hypothetical protein HOLleu_01482 [Holothuria leucospilota]|uniref:Uncharacterized protein n=1 Tax=Holothuria leucospilota TaxID=206669 RepID=A0A9Q1HJ95_HOLLE|nr:hypothetical protein HOLleu_01482 [Holothuria leucospilota]
MDPRLQHPFTCVIAGPTQCGKTVFLYKLLTTLNEVIKDPPEVILWFYGEYQPLYDKLATALAKEPPTVRVLPETQSKPSLGDNVSRDIQQKAVENEVLNSVPKALRNKAVQLLHKITSSDGIVDWNGKGELAVNERAIKGSNMVDLINDALRKRKSLKPIGTKDFSKALAKLNVPHELIGNPDRWQEMTKLLNPADSEITDLPELPESLPDDEELYGAAYHLPSKKQKTLSVRPKTRKKAIRWEKY